MGGEGVKKKSTGGEFKYDYLIHCKNICKYSNVPLPSRTIKKKNAIPNCISHRRTQHSLLTYAYPHHHRLTVSLSSCIKEGSSLLKEFLTFRTQKFQLLKE
jgi:hypothetical protein